MVNVIAFVDFCGDFIRFSAKYLWNSLTDRTIWIWKFGRQQSWHHVKSNARHTKNPLKMLRFIVLFQSLNWIEWQTLCHQNSVCQVVFFFAIVANIITNTMLKMYMKSPKVTNTEWRKRCYCVSKRIFE